MNVEELCIHQKPSPIAKDIVSRGTPVYVAINPIEYHGPHLSLQNDALIGKALARRTHEVLVLENPDWPMLWAADINAGAGPIDCPGSQSVSFRALCHTIEKTCRGLLELGVRNVAFITFHGAPTHNLAIQRGVKLLEGQGVHAVAPMNALLQELIHLDPALLDGAYATIADQQVRRELQRRAATDIHAGFLETSLALHFDADSVVDHRRVAPCPDFAPDPRLAALSRFARRRGRETLAAELDYMAIAAGWLQLHPFPGYTGRPDLATEEAGAALAQLFSERFAALSREVFAGRARSPEPILRWWDPLERPEAWLNRCRRALVDAAVS